MREERIEWVEQQLNRIRIDQLEMKTFTLRLFIEAINAYAFGLPTATILCISVAWNSLLGDILGLKREDINFYIPSTKRIIKKALKEKLIGNQLACELIEFQKTIRDKITHPKTRKYHSAITEWKHLEKEAGELSSIPFERFQKLLKESSPLDPITAFLSPETKTAQKGLELFFRLSFELVQNKIT